MTLTAADGGQPGGEVLDLASTAGGRRRTPPSSRLLATLADPVLDVGCGPGRIVAALAAAGRPALGVDPARGGRRRHPPPGAGAAALGVRPAAGRGAVGRCCCWTATSASAATRGPVAPVRGLVRPGGRVVAEVEPPGTRPAPVTVRWTGRRTRGPWFPWARVAADDVRRVAAAAGLRIDCGRAEGRGPVVRVDAPSPGRPARRRASAHRAPLGWASRWAPPSRCASPPGCGRTWPRTRRRGSRIPARPAGLYRVTQGVHVATGTARSRCCWPSCGPSTLAWSSGRRSARCCTASSGWPCCRWWAAACSSCRGPANVARWYPWSFFFPRAHFWAAWITVGALVVHVGPRRRPPGPPAGDARVRRRTGTVGAARAARLPRRGGGRAGGAGRGHRRGTVAALGPVSVLAQRRPGSARRACRSTRRRRRPASRPACAPATAWSSRARPPALALYPGRPAGPAGQEATLPIACVEGWSASARWRGVPGARPLELAGPRPAGVTVESLQGGAATASEVNRTRSRPDTLLALDLDGEPLHLDHGFPVRLIGPNRPGGPADQVGARLVVR